MKKKYWWFETEWHSKMDKCMQVNGMGDRTRQCYTRSMRQLVEHCDKTPDRITEEELLDYLVHRQNITGWAPATMRICHSGIKFFFKNVLKRDWHLLSFAHAKREKRLPSVLSRPEVQKILRNAGPVHNYAYFVTVYTCGRRHFVGCACGNRHCPQCQYHKSRQWLKKQLEKSLPGSHFMLTFTTAGGDAGTKATYCR